MYAVIRKYPVQLTNPDRDDFIRRVQTGFLPIISEVDGFVAYYVVDTGADVVSSVSVFDSQAGAEESSRRAASWVGENLAQFVQGPPEVTAGDVVAHQSK
jgi:hypothetical protein